MGDFIHDHPVIGSLVYVLMVFAWIGAIIAAIAGGIVGMIAPSTSIGLVVALLFCMTWAACYGVSA